MNRVTVDLAFRAHDRVRWIPERTADWAGAGLGEIYAYDPERPFFGADSRVDRPTPGPAYCIRLDGPLALEVWVPPEEIMPALVAP